MSLTYATATFDFTSRRGSVWYLAAVVYESGVCKVKSVRDTYYVPSKPVTHLTAEDRDTILNRAVAYAEQQDIVFDGNIIFPFDPPTTEAHDAMCETDC